MKYDSYIRTKPLIVSTITIIEAEQLEVLNLRDQVSYGSKNIFSNEHEFTKIPFHLKSSNHISMIPVKPDQCAETTLMIPRKTGRRHAMLFSSIYKGKMI